MRAILVLFTVLLTPVVISRSATKSAVQVKKKPEACDGPIYKATEVTKKAKVTRLVDPDINVDVLMEVVGNVQIRAVFCLNGKVTNPEVIQGEELPYG